jgi:hypothetical protein
LILVPEKILLSWIRFSSTKRNTTTVKLKPNCTHELTHQNTRWIFYSSNYWKPFFGSTLFYFFLKSHTTQPRFLADEKVSELYNVPFYQSLFALKTNETTFTWPVWTILITKNVTHDDKTTSSSKSIAKLFWFPFYQDYFSCFVSKLLRK